MIDIAVGIVVGIIVLYLCVKYLAPILDKFVGPLIDKLFKDDGSNT